MSAESNMVNPASRQMSTSRVASVTSLAPHALKNSLPPPNVPVPRLNTGTLKPECPSRLNSIILPPDLPEPHRRDRVAGQGEPAVGREGHAQHPAHVALERLQM